jgi:hypothetical protein
MKTTIELDDELYRQAKVLAAQRGISLKELVQTGLKMAMAAEGKQVQRKRVKFPLIGSPDGGHTVTSEEVYETLKELEDEEDEYYAQFIRR